MIIFPLVLMACLLSIASATTARADVLLTPEEALTEHEMETLRGGFLLAGGMVIDFALMRQTRINGELHTELQLSTQALMDELVPQDMNTLVQIGNGEVPLSAIQDIPGMVTIISNTADNSLIQNMSSLDLNVSNVALARQAALVPLLEFQLINAAH